MKIHARNIDAHFPLKVISDHQILIYLGMKVCEICCSDQVPTTVPKTVNSTYNAQPRIQSTFFSTIPPDGLSFKNDGII